MATTLAAPARAALGYDGALTCAINVSDLDAGIAWYRDTLGMELLYRVDEIAWCEFESPVARVSVGLAQVEQVIQGGGATLTFGVVDLDAAKAVLGAPGWAGAGDPRHGPAAHLLRSRRQCPDVRPGPLGAGLRPQSSMTCGTKRAVLPVMRPSSRMPMPAGAPSTIQAPITG